MPPASSAGCWAADPARFEGLALDFPCPKHDIRAQQLSPLIPDDFSRRQSMTDPNRQNDDAANPAQAPSPWSPSPTSCPTIPKRAQSEALAKEAAEARDKMLRTLAEMENLRKRTAREVADARTYGISGFARDVLDIADNLQRALDAVPGRGQGLRRSRPEGADRRRRTDRAVAAQHAGEERGEEVRSRGRRNSIRISSRRCTRSPIPRCPRVPWSRSCRPAT